MTVQCDWCDEQMEVRHEHTSPVCHRCRAKERRLRVHLLKPVPVCADWLDRRQHPDAYDPIVCE